MSDNDEHILERIRRRDFSVIEEFDDDHRQNFIAWTRKSFVKNLNDLEDAWQEALVIFYEQVISGRLTTLNSSPQTYVFEIGRRLLLNWHRKMSRVELTDDIVKINPSIEKQDESHEGIQEEMKELLTTSFRQLNERCKNLLTARIYESYSIPEIQAKFGFASESATSVHISRCLTGLKNFIKEKFPEEWKRRMNN